MNITIIISGGGSGIGYATAKKFLENLDNVVIAGKEKEKIQNAQKTLQQEYPKSSILALQTNMSNFIDVQLLCEFAMTHYGKINVVVNNCGTWSSKPVLDISEHDIMESFENNLKSTIVGTVVSSQFMKTNNSHNHIVNISSFAALMPRNNASMYSCFKSGIITFTKSSANELIQYGIKVNCVTPGLIETPMTHNSIAANEKTLLEPISMNRVGRAEEIAKVIYWLTTNNSSYINGTNIEVTGGKYLTQSE